MQRQKQQNMRAQRLDLNPFLLVTRLNTVFVNMELHTQQSREQPIIFQLDRLKPPGWQHKPPQTT